MTDHAFTPSIVEDEPESTTQNLLSISEILSDIGVNAYFLERNLCEQGINGGEGRFDTRWAFRLLQDTALVNLCVQGLGEHGEPPAGFEYWEDLMGSIERFCSTVVVAQDPSIDQLVFDRYRELEAFCDRLGTVGVLS